MLSIGLVLLFVPLWLAYKYITRGFNYWESQGIPYLKGHFPLGTTPNIIVSSEYQGYVIQKLYNKLSPHPFGGFYIFNAPQLLLRDLNIIQNVLIKDFAYFRNRLKLKNSSNLFIFKNLFTLEGAKWRALRVKLSPLFSTNKLKSMFTIFEQSSDKFRIDLKSHLKTDQILDVKNILTDFTTHLIVSCVFGTDGNHEQFKRVAHTVIPQRKTWLRMIRTVVEMVCPVLRSILPPLLPKQLETFLLENVKNTIELRENTGIQRMDFLNLLIELKNKGELHLSEKEMWYLDDEDDLGNIELDLPLIVAQCFVFFLAGLDGPSAVPSYVLYELAIHHEFQDRLRTEILEVMKQHDHVISYEALKDMKYLDQVVKEALRKYTTLPIITRICVKDYHIPGYDAVIKKGTRVLIPAHALHYDDSLFPYPERFDPERFSVENEKSITPCSFLPFGEGPRNCIGMRFGLFLIKLALVTVLSDYKVNLTVDNPIPLEMAATGTVAVPKVPIKLMFTNLNE